QPGLQRTSFDQDPHAGVGQQTQITASWVVFGPTAQGAPSAARLTSSTSSARGPSQPHRLPATAGNCLDAAAGFQPGGSPLSASERATREASTPSASAPTTLQSR